MNLLHLEYFYQVAKSQSFTQASRVLRVSQPAISKQVRLLEESLNLKLIERTTREFKLTPEGIKVYVSAQKIFKEVAKLKTPSEEFVGEPKGIISLGMSDNLAIHLFPEFFVAFQQKYPKITTQLFTGTSTEIKKELHTERCDFGLFVTPLQKEEPFRSEKIFEIEFMVCVHREVIKSLGLKTGQLSIFDLEKHRVPRVESRHLDYPKGHMPAFFHAIQLGLKKKPKFETTNHEVKKALVMRGYGFSLLLKHMILNELKSGALVTAKTPYPLRSSVFWVQEENKVQNSLTTLFKNEMKVFLQSKGYLGKV
jgi:DNA-binding transcriptional LysR family regulator